LHNKPLACGESVASAAGPFTTKKKLGFYGRKDEKLNSNTYVLDKGSNTFSSSFPRIGFSFAIFNQNALRDFALFLMKL
jgi:hypothetical protein